MRRKKPTWLPAVLLAVLLAAALIGRLLDRPNVRYSQSVMEVPAFSGEPYALINGNTPEFTQEDYTTASYEYYSSLDSLGRCGYAMACVGYELMPTQDRESISSVKPSGWVQAQYDSVDGGSLYNRCHLIGFQLTGENANERNLITGTRYMNVDGMLPFENMVADYIRETRNHVLYRVTPVYDEGNLVARGVQMEALSMEDSGGGICFNVYVYNNQPGIIIDYRDGTSRLESSATTQTQTGAEDYILNTGSKKFHLSTCGQAESIRQDNRREYSGSRQELIEEGYEPAGCCKP